MKNRIKILTAAALLVLGAGAAAVCAEEENTLIISYEPEGAVFDIYRAGEFNEDYSFCLSGDFAEYADSVNLSGLTASGWAAAAQTLYNYALTYDISPLASGTISDGTAEFSGLDRGLYLVSGSEITTGGYTYTSETFLVCLPNLDENSLWTNTAAVSPKFTKESESGGGESKAELFDLLIIWEGDNSDVRPETVVYTIYRDSEVYAVVTLSEENNWQYELKDLETGYSWTVTQEGLPEGYTTTIERSTTDEGTEVVITNIYVETAEETSTEAATETTKTSSGGSGGGGSSVIIGGETTTAEKSDEDTEEVSQGLNDSGEYNTDKTENEGEGTEGSDSSKAQGETGVLPGSSQAEASGGNDENAGLNTEGLSSGAAIGSESGEKLPQTGQLWLPVPIMVFCGLVLFIIGYIRYKRNNNEG